MKRLNAKKVFLICAMVCGLATFASADVVAYWPFGVSGLTDASGNGHSLTKSVAGVSLTNGLVRLNGTQTQFSTALPLDLSGCTNLTVEFWMRAVATANTGVMIEHTENYNLNTGAFFVDISEGADRFGNVVSGFNTSTGFNLDEAPAGAVTDGEWHHVALVYNAAKTGADRNMLYFDRVAQPTYQSFIAAGAMDFCNAYLYIGSRGNKSFKFIGDLDDIRISNTALAPNDFLQIRSDADAEACVVAYWPFDRGNELADASGHGNALVADSGVVFSNGVAILNGSQMAFHTAGPIDLTACSNLTIECFLRTAVDDGTAMVLEHSTDATNSPGAFAVSRTGDALIGGFRMDGGGNYDTSNVGTELTDNLWHHVALVYEATATEADRVRLYVDQIRQTPSEVYTNDMLSAFRNEILYIGTRANGEASFTGELDDIRVVDAVLATNQFLKAHSDDTSLVLAYWPFTRGNERMDASGHGFTLASKSAADVDFRDGTATFKGRSGLYTASHLDLSPFKAVTIEGFFRTTATNAMSVLAEMSLKFDSHRGAFILSTGLSLSDTMAAAYYNPQTPLIYNYEYASDNAINDGVWHHIAYVIDLAAPDGVDRSQLYLDGVRQIKYRGQASASTVPFVSDKQLFLGWRGSSPDMNFIGEMDDFRITAAALATTEFMTISDRTADPVTNAEIIAFWPFEATNGLADASGRGNTLTGDGVMFTDGAAVFGGGQTLKTAGKFNLTDYSAVTIEYFIRTTPQSTQMVLEQSANYGSSAGAFYCDIGERFPGSVLAGYKTTDYFNLEVSPAGAVSDDCWHHVALVIDSSKSNTDRAQLYVDSIRQTKYKGSAGRFLNDASFTPFINDTLYIGSRGNASFKFVGHLDDIRITGKALTLAEFLTRPTTVLPPVIAYWPFDRGRELEDASGNNNSLTHKGVVFNTKEGSAVCDGNQEVFGTVARLDLRFYDALTIECFVKSAATTNAQMLLEVSTDASLRQGAFSMVALANAGTAESTFTTAIYEYFGGVRRKYNIDRSNAENSVTDGQWHHLALVIDSAKSGAARAKLYFDRVPQSHVTENDSDLATAFLNAPFFIGSRANTLNQFTGELDDIRISGTALTPDQFLAKRSVPRGTIILIH